jgi:hypothetical protein
MRFYRTSLKRGIFSALEVAVVMTVLFVVATIVGPRMSRGAASSPQLPEQVLTGHLRALRGAIAAYAQDHGGRFPDGDGARVAAQLTQYTNWLGEARPTRAADHALGPYLREIPALPVGANRGAAGIRTAADSSGNAAGWIYDARTGRIVPATSPRDVDSMGIPFSES